MVIMILQLQLNICHIGVEIKVAFESKFIYFPSEMKFTGYKKTFFTNDQNK
jgi:hypothetical protein